MKQFYNKVIGCLGDNLDKVLHFGVCALLCLYGSLYNLGFGIFLPIFIGVVKEMADSVGRDRSYAREWQTYLLENEDTPEAREAWEKAHPHRMDWGDLVADLLGVLVTAVPLYFIMN